MITITTEERIDALRHRIRVALVDRWIPRVIRRRVIRRWIAWIRELQAA